MKWSKVIIGEFQLFISTILYAICFIGQRKATNNLAGPTSYNAWRHTVAASILIFFRKPLQNLLDNSDLDGIAQIEDIPILITIKSYLPSYISESTFDLYFWGIVCGLSNFVISTFQQYGLLTVSAGKAAFINGLFVVVTPLFAVILPGASNRLSLLTWLSVGLSFIGTYFLSDIESNSVGIGEIYLLCSMLGCVVSIMAADAGSKRVNCVSLIGVEFLVSSFLCTITSLYIESEMWIWPFLALQDGISMIMLVAFAEASAYLISAIGQTHSTSSRSALILSLESVFTALLGYVFLHETLTYLELFGCLLMFIATILSSIASVCRSNNKHTDDSLLSKAPKISDFLKSKLEK